MLLSSAVLALLLACASAGALTGAQASAASNGLVAAYNFDEGSGSTLTDRSGSGNDGTTRYTSWAAGHSGGALSFNGTSSWVTVPDSASLDLTSSLTLEAWVEPTALGTQWRTVLFKEQPGGMVYSLYANQDANRPVGQVNIGGEQNAVGPAALPLNTWTHIASTYDGSRLRLYVNGSLVRTTSVSGSVPVSNGALRIGGNSVWGEWFRGLVDDVRVYDRALSGTEIQNDMATPVPSTATDTTPPTAPGNLHATSVSQTDVDLAWTASTDDTGVTGYDVAKGGTTLGRVTATSYHVAGLTCGTSYLLGVTAVDAAGNRSPQSTVTVTTASCQTASGPVAAYSFDSGAGGTLVDDSGNGNDGTISNATWSSAGEHGGALSFNGTNSLVTVADDPSLDLTGAMTLEGWVKPASLGTSWRTVVVKEQPDQLDYALYAHDGGPGPSGHAFVGSDERAEQSSTLPAGTWTHLAATYDGTTLSLYVNGTKTVSTPLSGPIHTSSDPLRIGGNTVWGEWFDGLIDDVRIYDRALGAAEIQSDMTTPVGTSGGGGGGADTTPPTAPGGLAASSATQTSVGLSWTASTDDTGVAGYDVTVDGSKVGSTSGTTYTASGLSCGTTHTFGVVAYDAAGNRSPASTVTSSTSACGGGGTDTANLWIDPNGGSCTRAATPGAYADAAACGSFDAAFQKAQNGDTVLVRSGSYGSQTVNNRSGSAAPGVTIAPSAGSTVNVGSLTLCGADYLTVEGPMKLKAISNYDCLASLSTNDVFDGVTVDWGYDSSQSDGAIVGLYGNVANFTMRNSEIEHGYNVKGFYMSSWSSGGAYYPTNITLENSKVHSWNADNGIHTECVFANKVQGLTLRGNQFYDCLSTGDGIIGNTGLEANNPRDYLFENNVFELSWNNPPCPCGGHGVSFDGDAASLRGVNVFRYNLFETSMFTGSSAPAGGATVDFYGNVGAAPPCVQLSHSAYNIWKDRTCGPTDKQNANVLAPGNFVSFPPRPSTVSMPVDLAPGDWHYSSGSVPMVDAGDPDSTCSAAGALGAGSSPCRPAVDKDGNARPAGARPDAGPYEYR